MYVYGIIHVGSVLPSVIVVRLFDVDSLPYPHIINDLFCHLAALPSAQPCRLQLMRVNLLQSLLTP